MLSLVLLLAAVAADPPAAAPPKSSTIVVSFSDPANCTPCKQLEAVWRSPAIVDKMKQLDRRRAYIDVRNASPAFLKKWGVDRWPTTLLVEVTDDNKILKIYRKQSGAMSADDLAGFIEVPAER
jgi:hypothetical protein